MVKEPKVDCPMCGKSYTVEEYKQLNTVPSHPKKFWIYYRCGCGCVFNYAPWFNCSVEDLERASEIQRGVLLTEWLDMFNIRQTYLERTKCINCSTFSKEELKGEGAYADQERRRVGSIRKSCAYSLALTSVLEYLLDLVVDAVNLESTPDIFPDLHSIIEEFEAKLKAFRLSKHQDEEENNPIP